MNLCPGLCPHWQGLSPPDLVAKHEPVYFSVTRNPRRFCSPSKGSGCNNLTQDPSDQDLGQVQSPLTATKHRVCPGLRYRSRRHKGSISWFSREQRLFRRNEHQRHGPRKRSLIYWTPLKLRSSLWKTQDNKTCPRRRKKYCSLTLDKSDIPTIQSIVVKVPPAHQECWVWRRLDHILSFRPIWVTESDPCNKLRVAMN